MRKISIDALFRSANKGCYNPPNRLATTFKRLYLAKRILFVYGLTFASIILIQGCEVPDAVDTVADVQLKKLSKTWTLRTVTLDGAAEAGYESFTLTFSGASAADPFDYVTANRPQTSPWPSSGKCSFSDNQPELKMIRDPAGDAVPLTYVVEDGKLQISFTFSGTGYKGGYVLNVRGVWVFEFT